MDLEEESVETRVASHRTEYKTKRVAKGEIPGGGSLVYSGEYGSAMPMSLWGWENHPKGFQKSACYSHRARNSECSHQPGWKNIIAGYWVGYSGRSCLSSGELISCRWGTAQHSPNKP